MSERAWEAAKTAKMPKFYFDLAAAKRLAEKGQTPWTPALPQLFGLREGIRLIREEGLDNVFARHQRLGRMARAGARALGLKLLADETCASPAVTSIRAPEGLEAKALRKLALDKYGVVFAGGQGQLADSIFRIGHLGFVSETDVLTAITVLGAVLQEMGVTCDTGAALAATQSEM
jgi:aspartate aminotransferase-like enzyme